MNGRRIAHVPHSRQRAKPFPAGETLPLTCAPGSRLTYGVALDCFGNADGLSHCDVETLIKTHLAAAFLLVVGIAAAQSRSEAQPAFEVASVKPIPELGPPADIPANAEKSPGHFAMRDKPLRQLIEWAYSLKDYQIVGPQWIEYDERYVWDGRRRFGSPFQGSVFGGARGPALGRCPGLC